MVPGWWGFAFALAAMLLPFPAMAQLDARVKFGHANSYAAGSWTPLRITLENLPDGKGPSGGRDFRGHVEVRTSDTRGATLKQQQPIELPLQSRKSVEFEVMISTNSQVIVELVDEKGVVRVRREIIPPRISNAFGSLRHSIYVVPTVLVLESATETFSLPSAIDPPGVQIKTISAGELPRNYRGYDSVRVLVVHGRLRERLKPDQLEALDQWILFGGRLAVVTPRNHREIRDDPWMAERLPVLPVGVQELRMNDLDPMLGALPILLTRWESPPDPQSVLWMTGAGPAAIVGRHGAGKIYLLGIDPSGFGTAELATSIGRTVQALVDVWILGPGREDLRARHLWSTADIDPDFENVMLLPNIWIVTLLIVLFVVVVGPLNFLVLRRRRRLELAWATIPGLSLIFFGAVYVYGAAAKGGDQHFASSDILHLAPGSSEGLLLTSQIQFAPRRETYRLDPPEGGVILPLHQFYEDPLNFNAFSLNAYAYGAGNAGIPDVGSGLPTLIQDDAGGNHLMNPAEQWTMQFYQGEAPWKIEGSIEGSVQLLDGRNVSLRIRNDTPIHLEDAMLYIGEDIYPVGNIQAGESGERELSSFGVIPGKQSQALSPPTASGSNRFQDSADFLIRQGAAHAYPHFPIQNPQRRVRLVGENPDWKHAVSVAPAPDAEESFGLVEIELPVTWAGDRSFSSTSRLRREIYGVDSLNTQIDNTGNNAFCRLRDSSVEVVIGNAWAGSTAQFQGGKLSLSFIPYTEDLVVSVYNYGTGKWQPIYESARFTSLPRDRSTEPDDLVIRKSWVNPIEPMVRLRLAAHPQPPSAGGGSASTMFSGNYGVEILSIDAKMTLRGEISEPKAEPAPAPSPVISHEVPLHL